MSSGSRRVRRRGIENAERLLADAELLFGAERYPSAAALAVLALEEAGKALMLRLDRDDDDHRRHVHKQRSAAAGVLAADAYEVLVNTGAIDPGPPERVRTPEEAECTNPAILGRVRELLVEGLGKSMVYADPIRDWLQGASLNSLKQRGFYVDVDADGSVLGLPTSIGADDATNLLSFARRAVRGERDAREAAVADAGYHADSDGAQSGSRE